MGSFVIGSKYNPFTFDEMIKPYAMYAQAYKELEELAIALLKEADTYAELALADSESTSAGIYNAYNLALQIAASALTANGLSPQVRLQITNLRRGKEKSIGRLQRAALAREEFLKLRKEMSAKDSSSMYTALDLSLDLFLDGKTPEDIRVSGNEIQSDAMKTAAAYSSKLYSDPEFIKLDNYYKGYLQIYGLSEEEMASLMADNLKFMTLISPILEAHGVAGLNTRDKEIAKQRAILGFRLGITYSKSITPIRDESVMTASQKASNAIALEQLNLAAARTGMVRQPNGDWQWDSTRDPEISKATLTAKIKTLQSGNRESTDYTIADSYIIRSDGSTETIRPGTESVRLSKANIRVTENNFFTLPQKILDVLLKRLGMGDTVTVMKNGICREVDKGSTEYKNEVKKKLRYSPEEFNANPDADTHWFGEDDVLIYSTPKIRKTNSTSNYSSSSSSSLSYPENI